MNVYKLRPQENYGSNCYLLEVNSEYAIIDPSCKYEDVLEKHPNIEGKVKYILVTHAHFDHILNIDSWTKTGASVIIGVGDGESLANSAVNCYLGFLGVYDGYMGEYREVNDEELLPIGGENIRVITTPGHTKGGVTYRIGDYIFVGDTVFANGGYGRCDLPGGNIDVLEKSLFKLFSRENDGMLYPGHGPEQKLSEALKYFK